MPRQKVKILIGMIDDARCCPPERQEIWDRIERYVGIIVDRPIVGKVGRFDAKV